MSNSSKSNVSESKRKNHPWHIQPAVKKNYQEDKEILQTHEEITKEVRWTNRGKRSKR